MRFVCITSAVLLTVAVASANTLKDKSAAIALGEQAMGKVAKGDLKAAFQVLRPYTALPEAEFEAVVLQSISAREKVGNRYGATVDFEYVGTHEVGKSLFEALFLEKTEKTALPWALIFYRTTEGWTLNSFFWTDKITPLFTCPSSWE